MVFPEVDMGQVTKVRHKGAAVLLPGFAIIW